MKLKTSWYASGSRTANGERFNPDGMTAAHPHFPFGTKLCLTYKGRSATVRINDRGPFTGNRHLDVSRGVAKKLGFISSGVVVLTAKVC